MSVVWAFFLFVQLFQRRVLILIKWRKVNTGKHLPLVCLVLCYNSLSSQCLVEMGQIEFDVLFWNWEALNFFQWNIIERILNWGIFGIRDSICLQSSFLQKKMLEIKLENQYLIWRTCSRQQLHVVLDYVVHILPIANICKWEKTGQTLLRLYFKIYI